jgi:hypothetical protein
MATVDLPSPGLFAAVLQAVRGADPRQWTIAMAFSNLIDALTESEAEQLPAAVGGIMPLLRGDLDRLRFAAESLVRFDMFEAAPDLVNAAVETFDRDLLLSAAALCGNPGVEADVRDRLARATIGDRASQIRFDPTAQPGNERELLLYQQRWPGSRSVERSLPLAPVVVLDDKLGAQASIRLAARLDSVGATVRRLPKESALPDWFGPQTVACCRPTTRSRLLSYNPDFPERQILVDPALNSERDVGVTLQRINAVLPPGSRLRLDVYGPELETTIWDPDVYSLGVYETREAAFLTSAPVSSLYHLSKMGLLHPRRNGITTWSFSDLVAVRTWRFLKAQSSRRVSSRVIPALARFAGDPDAVRVGATSDGKVLVDRGQGWVDVRTGEQLLDLPIADLDESFRPFTIGGRRAPDMLHASENTRLHPAVLHGVPHLRDHRVSARALALLDDRGGEAAIYGAYPELEERAIQDTVAVGHQLVGAQ